MQIKLMWKKPFYYRIEKLIMFSKYVGVAPDLTACILNIEDGKKVKSVSLDTEISDISFCCGKFGMSTAGSVYILDMNTDELKEVGVGGSLSDEYSGKLNLLEDGFLAVSSSIGYIKYPNENSILPETVWEYDLYDLIAERDEEVLDVIDKYVVKPKSKPIAVDGKYIYLAVLFEEFLGSKSIGVVAVFNKEKAEHSQVAKVIKFSEPIKEMKICGNKMVLIKGKCLELYDITNPLSPALLDKVCSDSTEFTAVSFEEEMCSNVAVSGKQQNANEIAFYRIINGKKLFRFWSLKTGSTATAIQWRGKYMAVGDDDGNVSVYQIDFAHAGPGEVQSKALSRLVFDKDRDFNQIEVP